MVVLIGIECLNPFLLIQGTAIHPDLQSISQALDGLYGASLGPQAEVDDGKLVFDRSHRAETCGAEHHTRRVEQLDEACVPGCRLKMICLLYTSRCV